MKIISIPFKSGENYNYIPSGRPCSDLSVVLVTKFASSALENCLNSLFRNSDFSNEVLIICNSPSWQTVKLLQERHLQFWILNSDHCFMAFNLGAELATRKYISFLTDDMVVGPRWDSVALSIAGDGILGSLAFIDGVALLNEQYQIGSSGIFGKNIAEAIGYNPDTRYVDDQKFDLWCKKNSMDKIEGYYWPPWIHIRSDFLKDKFCYHGLHKYGHEIDFENRHKRYGWKVKTAYGSYIYHVRDAGNRDNLPEEYCKRQFFNGVRICASCGLYEEGIKPEHPEYIRVHQAGYWLCEQCRTKVEWNPISHKQFLG